MGVTQSNAYMRLRETQLTLARASALIGFTIAALALLGWLSGTHLLTTLIPRGAVMQANTAFAVLLLGAALWVAVRAERHGHVARGEVVTVLALALPAGALGLLTLMEFAAARPFGLDRLISIGPLQQPSGMSPISALAVAIGALATAMAICPCTRRGPWPQRLAAMLALSMLTVVYGYLFNAPVLYHLPQ